MPRKPLIYTDEHPYHIMARANNKEWFYLPIDQCWMIFSKNLKLINEKFGFKIYLFVLMSNHYHLIGSCSPKYNLGKVMAWFQKSISRDINNRTGRINHVFGGPYKACLIRHPQHFAVIFKYVARNPVKAEVTALVELYKYSTLISSMIPIEKRDSWFVDIPSDPSLFKEWLNQNFEEKNYFIIQQNIRKTIFDPSDRSNRRKPLLSE